MVFVIILSVIALLSFILEMILTFKKEDIIDYLFLHLPVHKDNSSMPAVNCSVDEQDKIVEYYLKKINLYIKRCRRLNEIILIIMIFLVLKKGN